MDRRDFLQAVAATAAAEILSGRLSASAAQTPAQKAIPGREISLAGYSLVAEFKNEAASWRVYEDLRTREGALVFVSSAKQTRMLSKSAEASMAEGPPYLGLSLKDIGLSSPDLLSDQLLRDGHPDPPNMKSAAPPPPPPDTKHRPRPTRAGPN